MDMQELLDLIAIRSYVVNSIANPIFDRGTIKDLDGILILLDKRIAAMLTSAEFKEYIGYADVKKAIDQVRHQNLMVNPDNLKFNTKSAIRK